MLFCLKIIHAFCTSVFCCIALNITSVIISVFFCYLFYFSISTVLKDPKYTKLNTKRENNISITVFQHCNKNIAFAKNELFTLQDFNFV